MHSTCFEKAGTKLTAWLEGLKVSFTYIKLLAEFKHQQANGYCLAANQFILHFKTQCSIMLHLSIAPVASLKRGMSDFGCKEEPFPTLATAIIVLFTLFPFLL